MLGTDTSKVDKVRLSELSYDCIVYAHWNEIKWSGEEGKITGKLEKRLWDDPLLSMKKTKEYCVPVEKVSEKMCACSQYLLRSLYASQSVSNGIDYPLRQITDEEFQDYVMKFSLDKKSQKQG